MQNEETLIELGFRKNSYGVWFFRGEHKTFTANVVTCNGPIPYVELFEATKQIDTRSKSAFKGRRLLSRIKDCCTFGSVSRALKRYDQPEQNSFSIAA